MAARPAVHAPSSSSPSLRRCAPGGAIGTQYVVLQFVVFDAGRRIAEFGMLPGP